MFHPAWETMSSNSVPGTGFSSYVLINIKLVYVTRSENRPLSTFFQNLVGHHCSFRATSSLFILATPQRIAE